MRWLLTALCLLMIVPSAVCEEAIKVTTAGIGRSSCASWLADADSKIAGENWLMGFWSGANFYSKNHTVGETTDGPGIIASVKKTCGADPSATLFSVAVGLFNRFDREGK